MVVLLRILRNFFLALILKQCHRVVYCPSKLDYVSSQPFKPLKMYRL